MPESKGFGLLFEMGCGKTLTAIAITGAAYQMGKVKRVLIVAPTSVCAVWPKEFSDYAAFPYTIKTMLGDKTKRLKELADSLQGIGLTHILAMGDMNDTPANPVYKQLEPTLFNLAEPLYRQGEGTIKYDGAWELIDMFFASSAAEVGPMKILRIPFLTTKDTAHAGTKPLRTYSGPRYLGGVSDHCPIMVMLFIH